jgi:arginine decarboxylase
VTREEGLAAVEPGEVVFVVLAEMATDEPGRRVVSSIGVAVPADPAQYGYLSEHHAFGQTDTEASDYAEDLAAGMLATVLGVPFDLDRDYNERKEQYRVGGLIVDSTSITQTATGDELGRWTTVVAAAVLI